MFELYFVKKSIGKVIKKKTTVKKDPHPLKGNRIDYSG
jgi:hypothetical protein